MTNDGKILTARQIEQFSEFGFCSPVRVLSADEAAGTRARLEAHEASIGGPIGPAHRTKSHYLFTWVDDLMRNDKVLDAVEDLIGPNILCWGSIFWIKEAQSPSYVGWHQDLQYWGLDYPPLSAHFSWAVGRLAQAWHPQLVALHASRGHDVLPGPECLDDGVLLADAVVGTCWLWRVRVRLELLGSG